MYRVSTNKQHMQALYGAVDCRDIDRHWTNNKINRRLASRQQPFPSPLCYEENA